MPGLPEWTARTLNPDVIVLVEATPDEIAGRRSKDTSRARDGDDIDLHQNVNREYAATAAVMTGATVSIIENHDNRIDVAVEQFRKILKNE
jgi:adenylate kinase